MNRFLVLTAIALLCLLATLLYQNQGLRQVRDQLKKTNGQLSGQLTWQNSMQRVVADIDASRTKELDRAKDEIKALEHDVTTGRRRLRISATCQPTATSGMANATGARLTDAAQRDYFTLRARIATANSQIAGLQDYINRICLAQ